MCPNTLQTQIMPASATISSGQRLDQLRTGLEHFHAEQSGQTSSPKSSCLSTTSAFTSAAMVSMLPRRVTDHDLSIDSRSYNAQRVSVMTVRRPTSSLVDHG
jgi:hypothetical protein